MKLGLDLRGGVHFLLNVDPNPIIKQRINGDLKDITQTLRKDNVKVQSIHSKNQQIIIHAKKINSISDIKKTLSQYVDYSITDDNHLVTMTLKQSANQNILKYTMDQTIQILTNRVATSCIIAVVQQQGDNGKH